MHGIEEGLLDKGCAEASDLLYERHEVLNTALGKRRSQAIKWHNKPRTLT